MTAPFAHPHKRLERMVFFSDAVYAIAITLLALELKLPKGEVFTWDRLAGMADAVLACATSFAVIGLSWWSHTRMAERLIATDGKVLALNLIRLFFITVIPFPTAVLMENGTPTAWVFYCFVMAMSGTTELLLWLYASRRPTLVGELSPAVRRRVTGRVVQTPVAFLISAAAARFVSFNAGWIVLTTVLIPAQWALGKVWPDLFGPDSEAV